MMDNTQLILIGAGVLLIIMLIYIFVQQSSAARKQRETEEAAKKLLEERTQEMIRMTALPLGWAVRSELLRGNMAALEDLMLTYVRTRAVESMAVVDENGNIILSSNRKQETQPYSQYYTEPLPAGNDISMIKRQNGCDLVLIPIDTHAEKSRVVAVEYKV